MTDQEITVYLRQNRYSKALNGLYDILPAVKKYIIANSGTADDAGDIFQDALVILYKKAQDDNFILSVPLKTYLLAIVKNLWLSELRRRNKLPVTTDTAEVAEETPSADEKFSLAKTAFGLLGEKCRQLLILFYFKKKSFRDIATQLAFSDEKTAKNQKYRCLQKAKENFLTLSNSSHAQ